MTVQQKGIILLIKSALTGEKYSLPCDFSFSEAIPVANNHQITAMLYYGALNCGIDSSKEEMQQLFLYICSAISLSENQLHEINCLFDSFNEEKIDYLPIKGTILKKLYPKPEMRSMSDADILVRTEQCQKIEAVMQKTGYTFKYESDHELVWEKGKLTVELHKRLVATRNKDFYGYFGEGWKFARLKSGNRYELSPEDFYIYLFVHLAKHYRAAGIGIKHFTDLWVYRNAVEIDDKTVKDKLKSLGLLKFHSNITDMLSVWFGDRPSDDMSDFITDVIFNSGSYGKASDASIARLTKNAQKKGSLKKAKLYRVFWLLFPSYSWMSQKYTVLKKAPILLPFYWVARWIKALFGDRQNIRISVDQLKDGTDEKITEYERALKYVGLSFDLDKKQDM